MWLNNLDKKIWNRVIDLVFDCFFVSHTFPDSQQNWLSRRIRGSSEALIPHIRRDLVHMSMGWLQPPFFEGSRAFLNDVALHLEIAAGLHFIEADAYNLLVQRLGGLKRLLRDCGGPRPPMVPGFSFGSLPAAPPAVF